MAAIDFGHNRINVALGDSLGSPIAEDRVDSDVDLRATEAIDHAARLLGGLRASVGIDKLAAMRRVFPVRSTPTRGGFRRRDRAHFVARSHGDVPLRQPRLPGDRDVRPPSPPAST
ncbi:hypothetical protein OG878_07440 [Streptomyces sp. NBC_00316]|nr:hypothetical protein [Streptomyces sp. NBC_00316]